MSIATRAVRGAFIVLVSSYANMGFGIVYGIIMARLLDPEHFGIFGLAVFFVSFFDVRGKLGLDYAFIHRQQTTEQLIATHWALQTGASLLTLLLVALASLVVAQLNYPSATPILMIALAAAMIVEAAGTTARAALEKELVFARSTAVVTGALFISYVIAVAWAAQGYTYWALLGQVAVNAAFSSVGFWSAYRQLAQRPSIRFSYDPELARWLLRFGAALVIGSFATLLLLQFDNFLVGTFVSVAALGFYAQAYKVAQWPTGLVTHIISRATLPTYAKLQNDPVRLSKAFEMSLWLILIVATPLALAIFVSAPDFLILLYGEKWLPSAILLRFLIGYSLLRPLLDDTGALFVATGRPKFVTTVLTTQAITLMFVATPLTLQFDAVGTAIGVGVAFTVGIALTYRLVTKAISLDLVHVFAPTMLAAFIALGLYFLLARQIDLNLLPLLIRVIVKGALAIGFFAGVILLIERHALVQRANYIAQIMLAR